jgi:hypothetical protein
MFLVSTTKKAGVGVQIGKALQLVFSASLYLMYFMALWLCYTWTAEKGKIRQSAKLGLQIHRVSPIDFINLQHHFFSDWWIFCSPIGLGLQMLQCFLHGNSCFFGPY